MMKLQKYMVTFASPLIYWLLTHKIRQQTSCVRTLRIGFRAIRRSSSTWISAQQVWKGEWYACEQRFCSLTLRRMFGISRNPCGLHLIRVKGAEMFLLQFCVCDVALVWLRAVGRIAGQECVDCPGLGFRFRVLTTPLVNLRGAKDMRLLRAHLRNCTSCRLWTGVSSYTRPCAIPIKCLNWTCWECFAVTWYPTLRDDLPSFWYVDLTPSDIHFCFSYVAMASLMQSSKYRCQNYLYLLLFIIQSEIACEERNTISRYRVHMLWR